VSELKELGLITPADAEEIIIDGFDLRDGLFVLEVDAEANSSSHKASLSKSNSETFRANKRRGANQFEAGRE
jgi:hypothetical protein